MKYKILTSSAILMTPKGEKMNPHLMQVQTLQTPQQLQPSLSLLNRPIGRIWNDTGPEVTIVVVVDLVVDLLNVVVVLFVVVIVVVVLTVVVVESSFALDGMR